MQRQVVAQRRVHERALAAKVAPDAAGVHHDALFIHAPDRGQLFPQGVGVLVVDPEMNLSGVLGVHHAGVGFDVGLVHELGVEGVLEDEVSLGEPLVNVALSPGDVGEHVVDVRLRLRQTLVAG